MPRRPTHCTGTACAAGHYICRCAHWFPSRSLLGPGYRAPPRTPRSDPPSSLQTHPPDPNPSSACRADDDDFLTRPDGSRPAWFWTGPAPSPAAPGALPDGTLASLALPRLSASRREVLAYFDNSWLLTEVLFAGLQGPAAFYRPPGHSLRHPMIFYYAHPAALYVNKLRVAGLVATGVNAEFEHIFETGVDEMAWDDLSTTDMLWPRVRRPRLFAVALPGHPHCACG